MLFPRHVLTFHHRNKGRKSGKGGNWAGSGAFADGGGVTSGIRISTVRQREMDRLLLVGLPARSELFPLTFRLRVVTRRTTHHFGHEENKGTEPKKKKKKKRLVIPQKPGERTRVAAVRSARDSSIQFRSKSRDIDTELGRLDAWLHRRPNGPLFPRKSGDLTGLG